MPKFKVGDKVRIVSKKCYFPSESLSLIGKIMNIDDVSITVSSYLGCVVYIIDDMFFGECDLELVEQPITNTIITDIKDEAQHKRVQEKLESLGYKNYHWEFSFGGSIEISGNDNPFYWNLSSKKEVLRGTKELKQITASEFLGEEEVSNDIIYPSVLWGNSYTSELIKLNNASSKKHNKIMSNIMQFAKDLTLSKEEKLLRKYGLKNECGSYTPEAASLVMEKLTKDNEAYLLEIATAKQEEDKNNK